MRVLQTVTQILGRGLKSPMQGVDPNLALAAQERLGISLTDDDKEKKDDRPEFPNPVDLVLAGGTSMIRGFESVVRDELGKLSFPIPVKTVRVAEDPLNSVAKGCLVAAMSELAT